MLKCNHTETSCDEECMSLEAEKGLNGRVSGVEGNGGVLAVREEIAL